MKRIAMIVVSMSLVAGAISAPALAGSGAKAKTKAARAERADKPQKAKSHKSEAAKGGALAFAGMVTAVGEDSLTFTTFKGNKAARRWVSERPGGVTVGTAGARFGGPGRLGRSLADYRAGDGVVVFARADGDTLKASYVKLMLQSYEGAVAAYSPGESVSVEWTEANRLAEVWMAANGSPDTVTAAIVSATKVGGDMPDGSPVELRARPAANGSGLEAVAISGEEADQQAA